LAFLLLLVLVLTPVDFLIAQAPPNATDREKYQQAIKLFNEANEVAEGGTDSDKRGAIGKFLSAAAILNKLGRLDGEANALNAAAMSTTSCTMTARR
jgi:hypothetical protein